MIQGDRLRCFDPNNKHQIFRSLSVKKKHVDNSDPVLSGGRGVILWCPKSSPPHHMVYPVPKDIAMSAFLDVETSLLGRRWVGPSGEELRLAEAMEQETSLPLPLAKVLVSRGISPPDAPAFLAPKLRDLLPDPMTLRDMGVAADRLIIALKARERIAIFADYDVDGGTSAALLLDWLRQQGHDATLYVPDRIDEGYGPNPTAMGDLAANHDLIVCVDCGTLSFDAIAAAKAADVVIIDHHLAGEELPDAMAVVNPNRQDESGDLAHLCAAAVVFLVLVEANRRLAKVGTKGPDLMGFLDLVALATVADVAPLTGLNRALVVQGLKVMGARARPGFGGFSRCRRAEYCADLLSFGLCPWAARQRGRARWQSRSGCKVPVVARPRRSAGHGRAVGSVLKHRTPRD